MHLLFVLSVRNIKNKQIIGGKEHKPEKRAPGSPQFFHAMEPPSKGTPHLGSPGTKKSNPFFPAGMNCIWPQSLSGNRQFRNRTAALDIASFSKNNILYPVLWERRGTVSDYTISCRASCGDIAVNECSGRGTCFRTVRAFIMPCSLPRIVRRWQPSMNAQDAGTCFRTVRAFIIP